MNKTEPPEKIADRHRRVLRDGEPEHQTLFVAVTRHEADACLDGGPNVCGIDHAAVYGDFTVHLRCKTGNGARDVIRAASADSRETGEFAGAQRERHTLNASPAHIARFENDWRSFAIVRRIFRRRCRILAGHRFDERIFAQRTNSVRADQLAVAQYRHCVADVVHFLQVMRNEQHRDARIFERSQVREESCDCGGFQMRRRLVEDDESRAERERAHDFDELTRLNAEFRGACLDVQCDMPLVHEGARSLAHRIPGDAAAALQRIPVQKDIFRNGEVRNDHRVLVDARDFGLPCRAIAVSRCRLAVKEDAAAVRLLQTRKQRDQRGFSRAVSSDERVRFTRRNRKRHGIERRRRAVAFGNLDSLRHGSRGHCVVLPQNRLSSTFALVMSGAGNWSSSMPFAKRTMRLPWLVRPGLNVLCCNAAAM